MSGFTVYDPQNLVNFASGVQDLITDLNTVKANASHNVAVPPVKFGQDAAYPASLQPSPLAPALMFQGLLQQHMADFDDNFKTLIDKLTLLMNTANAIAKNYTTAAEADSLSAAAVNTMLDAAAPGASTGTG